MDRRNLLALALAAPAIMLSVPAAAASKRPGHAKMLKRLRDSGKTLDDAERSQGPERDRLMEQHMQMMGEQLRMMEEMKAPEDMSMEEHVSWIRDHQQVMQEMLTQMRRDHDMMKGRMHECMGGNPAGMGGKSEHGQHDH